MKTTVQDLLRDYLKRGRVGDDDPRRPRGARVPAPGAPMAQDATRVDPRAARAQGYRSADERLEKRQSAEQRAKEDTAVSERSERQARARVVAGMPQDATRVASAVRPRSTPTIGPAVANPVSAEDEALAMRGAERQAIEKANPLEVGLASVVPGMTAGNVGALPANAELTGGQQAGRVLGTLAGAIVPMSAQARLAGAAARALPAGSIARSAATGLAGRAATPAGRVAANVVEGIGYDLASPAESLEQRLTNVGIGAGAGGLVGFALRNAGLGNAPGIDGDAPRPSNLPTPLPASPRAAGSDLAFSINPRREAPTSTERIVAAAVLDSTGKPHAGGNHALAEMAARDAGVQERFPREARGFVTSTGRYVTKEEALEIANAAQQTRAANAQLGGERELHAAGVEMEGAAGDNVGVAFDTPPAIEAPALPATPRPAVLQPPRPTGVLEEIRRQVDANVDAKGKALPFESTPSAGDVRHGLVPDYRTSAPAGYTPDPTIKIPKSGTPRNIPQVVESLERLHAKHPDALSSEEAWAAAMADLVQDTDVPFAPVTAIRYATDPEELYGMLARATPEQVQGWWAGRSTAKRIGQIFQSGQATPETTGAVYLWGLYSRGIGAFPQEGAFIDAMRGGIMPYLTKAANGTLTADEAAHIDEVWRKTIHPEGAPGRRAAQNTMVTGQNLLKLSQPGASGRPLLAELHELLSNPETSAEQIRRWWQGASDQGLGIDNKVLSFIMLVTGRPGLVFDRVQIDHLFAGERFPINIYEGIKVSTTKAKKAQVINGTSVGSLFNGTRGAAIYELMERSLRPRMAGVLEEMRRRNPGAWEGVDDFDIGDFHWLSWVIRSDQVVDHATINAFPRIAAGDPNPTLGLGVKEGKFGTVLGSGQYIDTPAGPMLRYPLSDGRVVEGTVEGINAAINAAIKKMRLPKEFNLGNDIHGNPRTDYWYTDPRIDRAAVDAALLSAGRVVDDAGAPTARAAGAPADLDGPGGGGGTRPPEPSRVDPARARQERMEQTEAFNDVYTALEETARQQYRGEDDLGWFLESLSSGHYDEYIDDLVRGHRLRTEELVDAIREIDFTKGSWNDPSRLASELEVQRRRQQMRGGTRLYANPLDPGAIREALGSTAGRTTATTLAGAGVGAAADAATGDDSSLMEGALAGAAVGAGVGLAGRAAARRVADETGAVGTLAPPPGAADEALGAIPAPPSPAGGSSVSVDPGASPGPSTEMPPAAKERIGTYQKALAEGKTGAPYLNAPGEEAGPRVLNPSSSVLLDPSGDAWWRFEEEELLRQGVTKRRVSDEEVRAFADEVDLPELVKSRAQSLDTAQLMALGNAIQGARRRLTSLDDQLSKMPPGAARDELEDEAGKVFQALISMDKKLTAAGSEQGRGLRILAQLAATQDTPEFGVRAARRILGMDDLPPEVEEKIRAIYNNGRPRNDPTAKAAVEEGRRVLTKRAQYDLARYLQTLQSSTPGELVFGTRRWSMLTAPATHVLNTASGAVHSTTEGFVVKPLAAAWDRWIARRAADERRVTFSSTIAAARLRGMKEGAKKALGTDEYMRAATAAAANGEGKLRQIQQGGRAALEHFMSGIDPDNPLAALNQRRINYGGSLPSWASPAARLLQIGHDTVYAVMNLPDQIFFTGALRGSMQERAELRALREGLKRGTPEWSQRVGELTDPLTANSTDVGQAFADALYETFKGKSALSGIASEARRRAPRTMDFLAPFTLTPINLFLTTLDYTPVIGAARNEARLAKQLSAGTIDQATRDRQRLEAWTRSFGAGSALMLYGMQLRSEGRLELPYSTREKEEDRNMRAQEDIPEGAIKVGDSWHRIGLLGPQSLVVLGGGAMYDAWSSDPEGSSVARVGKGIAGAGLTTIDQISDLPVMQTLGDIKDAAGGKLDRFLVWGGRTAASFTPFGAAVAAGARAMDPVRDRRPGTVTEGIKDRFPVLREQVPEKVSGLGDTTENPGLLSTVFDPSRTRQDRVGKGDAVIDVLHQYNVDAGPITKGEGEPGAEVAARQKEVGQAIRRGIQQMIGDTPPQRPQRPQGGADDTAFGRYRARLRQYEQDLAAWEDWRDTDAIVQQTLQAANAPELAAYTKDDIPRLAEEGWSEEELDPLMYKGWTAEQVATMHRRLLLEKAIQRVKTRATSAPEAAPRRARNRLEETEEQRKTAQKVRERMLREGASR